MFGQVSGNQLTLEHKTPVEGMPRAMTYFQGRVLVGIRYLLTRADACECETDGKRQGQGQGQKSEEQIALYKEKEPIA